MAYPDFVPSLRSQSNIAVFILKLTDITLIHIGDVPYMKSI